MTKPVSSPRLLSPRDWSLRVRLAVVLLVPGILAIALGGLRIADQTSEATELDRVARFATVQGQVATLVDRVQQERLRATTFVAADRRGDRAALEATFTEVDGARAETRPAVEALYGDAAGLAGAHRQAEQSLARLADLRGLVLTSKAPPSSVVARYSELIGSLVELNSTLLRGINTTEVNGLASAIGGLAVARNEALLQLTQINAATSGLDSPAGTLAGLQAGDARLRTGLSDFRAGLDAAQRVQYGALIAGAPNSARGRLVQGLLARKGDQPLTPAAATEAATVYEPFLAELSTAETGVRAELGATSADRRQSAVNLALLNAVLLVLAIAIGTVIVGLIARAMISSLRTLRRSALDVAQTRLPEAIARMREGSMPDVNVAPVPVTSREEVGEVARAFDAVHSQAVRLAAEQATLQGNVNAMFVNLSRRSQTLVDRQLQLIEQLESNEQDPDQLSNLFRLDHLATRMRRNSENLLVLAGTDLAKRTAYRVPIVDVLRAAVSEIEQYERIIVEQAPAVAVSGRAASDLQHLLAELLDNATSFSPPESRVVMSASRAPNGSIVVEIADNGVGMRVDELEQTNNRLGRRSEVTVTASKRMGLFVVGRLAARHGVEVRLHSGPTIKRGRSRGTEPGTVGLTARVTIPAHMIDTGTRGGPAPEQTGSPEPANRPELNGRSEQSGQARPSIQAGSNGQARQNGKPEQQPSVAHTASPGPHQALVREPAQVPPGDPSVGVPEQRVERDPLPRRPVPGAAVPLGGAPRPQNPRPVSQPPVSQPPVSQPPVSQPPVSQPPVSQPPVSQPAVSQPAATVWSEPPGQDTGSHHIRVPQPEPAHQPPPADPPRRTIFQEVDSGWFRSYRPVPMNWQAEPDRPTPPADPVRPPRQPSAARSGPQPGHSQPPSARPPAPREPSSAFATGADDGWRAASGPQAAEAPGLTSNGLPRRSPGARLIPGAVGADAASFPTRDAEAVRGRLGDYQRGVHRGRGTADPTPSSSQHADPHQTPPPEAD